MNDYEAEQEALRERLEAAAGLYAAAKNADDAWHEALIAEYGERGAIEHRYKVQGKDDPQGPAHLMELRKAYLAASAAYFNRPR